MDLTLIYLICFGTGLLFALLSAAFSGGDTDADSGGAGGHTGDVGFSPLGPTTVGSFVTAFGGFGMIFSRIDATSSPWTSLPLSAIGGMGVASAVFFGFHKIFHLTQSSSEGRVDQLIGSTANVITPIPSGAVGEISYVQGGSRYSAAARAEDSAAIPAGATVRIVRIVGTQFYVSSPFQP